MLVPLEARLAGFLGAVQVIWLTRMVSFSAHLWVLMLRGRYALGGARKPRMSASGPVASAYLHGLGHQTPCISALPTYLVLGK